MEVKDLSEESQLLILFLLQKGMDLVRLAEGRGRFSPTGDTCHAIWVFEFLKISSSKEVKTFANNNQRFTQKLWAKDEVTFAYQQSLPRKRGNLTQKNTCVSTFLKLFLYFSQRRGGQPPKEATRIISNHLNE